MERGQGISLKTKFLVVLILFPIVASLAYMAIALQVFREDKRAYVYDSSSQMSRSLAAQVKSEFGTYFGLVRPIVMGYVPERGTINEYARDLFEKEKPLEMIGLYRFNSDANAYKRSFLESKDEALRKEVFSQQSEEKWIEKMMEDQVYVGFPLSEDRIPIGLKIPYVENTYILVFFVIKRPSFVDVFTSKGSQLVYLTNSTGQVWFGAEKQDSLSTSYNMDFLKKGVEQKQLEKVAETSSRLGDRTFLASYSKVGLGDLYIISFLDKNKAFEAEKVILYKSGLFLFALCCLIVFVSILAAGKLTEALSRLSLATRRVAMGHFDVSVNVKSRDEIGVLADSFNRMAKEVARLMKETAQKARMESELKTAQTVQETLFPPMSAQLGPIQISGFYEPASECGGDWWYYSQNAGKCFFWIGDATGHGAPAALITSAARSASSILENLKVTPSQAMELLNRAIYDVSKGQIMMTFFLACYDPMTHEFTYCNASHDPPFLFSVTAEQLKRKNLVPLMDVNNPRLGQDRNTRYKQTSIRLEPGQRVFFYTDGLIELYNGQQEQWGEREFIKALCEANKQENSLSEVIQIINTKLNNHRQGAPLNDDVTYFIISNQGSI